MINVSGASGEADKGKARAIANCVTKAEALSKSEISTQGDDDIAEVRSKDCPKTR